MIDSATATVIGSVISALAAIAVAIITTRTDRRQEPNQKPTFSAQINSAEREKIEQKPRRSSFVAKAVGVIFLLVGAVAIILGVQTLATGYPDWKIFFPSGIICLGGGLLIIWRAI